MPLWAEDCGQRPFTFAPRDDDQYIKNKSVYFNQIDKDKTILVFLVPWWLSFFSYIFINLHI
jgi:hypothetical protein